VRAWRTRSPAFVSLASAGGWVLGRRRQRAARGPIIAGAAAAVWLAGRRQECGRLVPGVAEQVGPGAGRRRRRRRRRRSEAQGNGAVPEALLSEAAGSAPRDSRPRLRYGNPAPPVRLPPPNRITDLGGYFGVCAIGGSIDFSTGNAAALCSFAQCRNKFLWMLFSGFQLTCLPCACCISLRCQHDSMAPF
jgi:hypothetical protein